MYLMYLRENVIQAPTRKREALYGTLYANRVPAVFCLNYSGGCSKSRGKFSLSKQ